ncbi:MAG: hypothetical protein J1E60_01420 [Christensenellaceae bacterium]|nr:hypothetical protein [Christensenellaceae bacterium]
MKNSFRRLIAFLLVSILTVAAIFTPSFADMPVGSMAHADTQAFAGIKAASDADDRAVPPGFNMTAAEWEVLRLTNHQRFLNGAQPLTAYSVLQNMADVRAEELTRSYSHTRPDGTSCFTVFAQFGVSYSFVAENIAAGYPTPSAVVTGWMNSTGHRENILNPDLVHLGVGMKTANDYYGHYWVQLFHIGFSCEYTSFSFIMPQSTVFAPGTTIDQMGIIGVLNCRGCGTCYLPISGDFCSGYNPNLEGVQHVTVSCRGISGTFDIEIASASTPSGDVDGDGTVSVADALLVVRHAMQVIYLNGAQISVGDMDGDGVLTISDAVRILRISLGIA